LPSLLTARRRTAAALAAAAVLVVLGGCSDTVELSSAAQDRSPACASAAAVFPSDVSGMPRRPTSVDGATGAWGDPAVIARCGVAAPGPTDTECVEVDGVGWIPETLSDGTRFTSFGTEPALEVLVPKKYSPEPLLLPAFSAAAQNLPANGLACR
jgi:hypothetical protein